MSDGIDIDAIHVRRGAITPLGRAVVDAHRNGETEFVERYLQATKTRAHPLGKEWIGTEPKADARDALAAEVCP